MVGEGGMKNALDPSLGSQAPSVASVLRAVIWLQQRLTLQIDGDWGGWGISKISFVVVMLHDFRFSLLQRFHSVALTSQPSMWDCSCSRASSFSICLLVSLMLEQTAFMACRASSTAG